MSKSQTASLRRCMRPEAPIEPGERIDLAGALLLPAFVDGHIHLDKTHWGAPRLPHVEGRSVRERIAAERVERHRVALPIEARASALIRTLDRQRHDAHCAATSTSTTTSASPISKPCCGCARPTGTGSTFSSSPSRKAA